MKRVLVFLVAAVTVVGLSGVAFAQMGWGGGYGPGYGHMRGGWGMGPGMMAGYGPGGGYGCPGMAAWGPGPADAQPVTKEKAQALAQEYAKQNLPGFTVERLLPFERRFGTMYQAELRGPKGETRLLHVNPWGRVMPFGGPVTP